MSARATTIISTMIRFPVNAERIHGFDLLAAGALSMGRAAIDGITNHACQVKLGVLPLAHHLKVIYHIVQLVTVFMVDLLLWVQLATKMLLHDVAVFLDVFAINANTNIALFVNPEWDPSALVKWIASAPNSGVMFGTETFSSMRLTAARNCTFGPYSHGLNIAQCY
jgi:hypothetical protein